MIPITGFNNLTHELVYTLLWYNTNLHPYTHVFWARTATKLLNFAPKRGLAW